jgi:hypothetical protein
MLVLGVCVNFREHTLTFSACPASLMKIGGQIVRRRRRRRSLLGGVEFLNCFFRVENPENTNEIQLLDQSPKSPELRRLQCETEAVVKITKKL